MRSLSRRAFLASLTAAPALAQAKSSLSKQDDAFLEDLSRRCFLYFWEQADPNTGLVLDRARADGSRVIGRSFDVASTALTGFYLTALCIAFERKWRKSDEIRERVRAALRHLAGQQENVLGWYYHFVNRKSGERVWHSELSTIDTAFLLGGVITAQQYFQDDAEIYRLAAALYARVDFAWLFDERTNLVRMGWTPETGFLRVGWKSYDEQSILYILGIASPTHPLPASCWYAFGRDPIELCGYRFVGRGPIFTHQYSQVWLDLANLRDGPPYQIDYFQNSVRRHVCAPLLVPEPARNVPSFSENLWGVSPSDSDIGYLIWGEPLSRRNIDGTVVPCAAGGSLMFAPAICLTALHYMYSEFGERIYGPYGFADSFHPLTGWVNPDVVGINAGITLLSAENLRSQFIWRWFNRSPDIQQGMRQIFQPC